MVNGDPAGTWQSGELMDTVGGDRGWKKQFTPVGAGTILARQIVTVGVIDIGAGVVVGVIVADGIMTADGLMELTGEGVLVSDGVEEMSARIIGVGVGILMQVGSFDTGMQTKQSGEVPDTGGQEGFCAPYLVNLAEEEFIDFDLGLKHKTAESPHLLT